MLRAVGMTRSQLRSAIRWESVIIAVQGTLLGLVIGVFFGWALVTAMRDEGLTTFTVPMVRQRLGPSDTRGPPQGAHDGLSRHRAAPAIPLHERPEIHARRWFLLAIMCLSLVLVVMSVSGLNTGAADDAARARGLGVRAAVDRRLLRRRVRRPAAERRRDRRPVRPEGPLLAGLAVFGVGALMGGLASDATQVIASRAVMGIGAAFIMPATLSIITSIFPPEERPRAIAIWAGFAGAGASIGPIVTGGLLEGFWWGSTLLVNVPMVVAIMRRSGRSHPTRGTTRRRRSTRWVRCCRWSA